MTGVSARHTLRKGNEAGHLLLQHPSSRCLWAHPLSPTPAEDTPAARELSCSQPSRLSPFGPIVHLCALSRLSPHLQAGWIRLERGGQAAPRPKAEKTSKLCRRPRTRWLRSENTGTCHPERVPCVSGPPCWAGQYLFQSCLRRM